MNTDPNRRCVVMNIRNVVVVVLLCGALALGGCAQVTTPSANGEAPAGSPVEIRDRAAQLYAQWAGTPDQQQAAEVMVAYGWNGAFSACLEARGISQPWQNFLDPILPSDPLAASLWAATPNRPLYSQQQVISAKSLRAEYQANQVDGPDSVSTAQDECREGNEAIGETEMDALRRPEGYAGLESAWNGMLEEAGRPDGTAKDYVACLREQLPRQTGMDGIDGVFNALDEQIDPNDVPLGSEQPTAIWTEFLELEGVWLDVDWDCRRDHYDSTLMRLEPHLDQFANAHDEELVTLARIWEGIENEARSHGWAPGEPDFGPTVPKIPVG